MRGEKFSVVLIQAQKPAQRRSQVYWPEHGNTRTLKHGEWHERWAWRSRWCSSEERE